MKTPDKWPQRIKNGNAVVTVYRYERTKGQHQYLEFKLAYFDPATGKRKLEAFEGTDACLRRGGELAGKEGGAVAVKLAGENHDLRFDIPCIGPQTVETCRSAGIAVLAVEQDKTLLLERDQLEQSAREGNVTLTTVSNNAEA